MGPDFVVECHPVFDDAPGLEAVTIPERGSLTRQLLENAFQTHAIALEKTVTMATFPLMYEAVLQGIGVGVFLCNSSLIKKSVKEIPIREMPQKHETHLIATKDRVGLKLISEFINSEN